MKLTVKQPLSFWADITASPFSGEQTAGTVTNLTEDSSNIERIQGATLANSHVIGWEILHPDYEDSYTASYTSSNEGVATVNDDGVLTVVSDGDVVITVTITRASDGTSKSNSIEVRVDVTSGSSIDYISNASGSVGKAFDDSLGALISSSDPSTAKPRFSSRNTETLSFTRNEDFWGIGLDGLSAISPNNSRSANKRSGTAITKRHVITTGHYPLRVGDKIDFVADASGSTTATRRAIQEVKTHPLYAGQSGNYCYDIQVCLLDSDLPSDIDIMEVIPSDYEDYVGQYSWLGTSCVTFDQEQKGLTRLQLTLGEGIYYGNSIPNHWFSTHNPSSMLNGFNYVSSTKDFSTPSDFVSPRLVSSNDPLYTHTESIIVGDSGAPNCFVLGSKLVLIGLNTYPTGGAYLPNLISDINQLISDVDALAGISTGYGVTECDLSAYSTPDNGIFQNTGYESFTNASATGFTASNTTGTGFAVSDILDGVSGDAVSVSFDIDITNGSPSISLRTALNGGSTASNSVAYTSSGSKTATLTGFRGYVGIGFTEGDTPSNFTVSNFRII